MNWSDLPFFLAVGRSGQIARAAGILNTDATTVARRVRRLEHDLGERLFEQDAHGQTLTQAGMALMQRVEIMASIADEIGVDINRPQLINGTVRISVPEGFAAWFIGQHLHEFADRYPGASVDMVAATNGVLSPARRETDIAIMLARPQRGPLIIRKLTDYRLNAYASRRYLDSHSKISCVGDLVNHRLIGYMPDIIYAPELLYLEELKLPSRLHLRSSSIIAQYKMVTSGAGIGVLPTFIADSDDNLVHILPDVTITRSYWLATHRETNQFPQVRAFIDWLVEVTAKHLGELR